MALLAHRTTDRPFQRLPALALILSLGSTGWIGLAQGQPQLYRWVDEKGETHYTDQVPPAQADKARTRLSEEGIHVEQVPRAPTEEELQEAREAERRKAEEARRLEEQQAADEQLLKTYRSIEDLELARDGKIAAVESVIQVKRDGVRAETQKLLKLNEELKALESAGKDVPAELRDNLHQSVLRIRAGYAEVVDNEYRKQDLRNEFERIVAHYRALKRLPPAEEPVDDAAAVLKLSILVGCKGEEQCLRYWERAVGYVRQHSDSKKEVSGAGLLIAFQQDEREDRSLTLSWTQEAPDRPVHLYLDVQCKNRLTASLYCINPTIPQIRDGFQTSVVLEGEEGG